MPPQTVPHDHQLVLHIGAHEARLLSFPGSVAVAWSPDSRFIALTNHEASNAASLHLFAAQIPPRELQLLLPTAAPKILNENHHAYAELVRWRGNNFEATVSGNGATAHGRQTLQVLCDTTGTCK